jgi:hypothetical protein
MEAHHWFLLGMMVAWTPCLIILSVMVCRARHEPDHNDKDAKSLDIKVLPFASREGHFDPAKEAEPDQPTGKSSARIPGDANTVVLLRTKMSSPKEHELAGRDA